MRKPNPPEYDMVKTHGGELIPRVEYKRIMAERRKMEFIKHGLCSRCGGKIKGEQYKKMRKLCEKCNNAIQDSNNKKKMIQIRIDDEIYDRIKASADAEGVSILDYCRQKISD